jgi:FtsP/CotA-like multicopper oxidase with cupredoxin domain
VVNATNARYFRLAIPRQPFLWVGADDGLFELPVEVTELLLAPAQRAELLLTATDTPGGRTTLEALPYDRGAMIMFGGSNEGDGTHQTTLLNIAYSAEPAIPTPATPPTLRSVPGLDTTGATARTITLTEDMVNLKFFLDGKMYDPSRMDGPTTVGSTEIWSVVNGGDMDHPFHIHGNPFQVLDRNGVPEPFVAWKDTVNLKSGDTVRLAVPFTDFKGPRMYHCHILEHEDQGMMAQIDVQ